MRKRLFVHPLVTLVLFTDNEQYTTKIKRNKLNPKDDTIGRKSFTITTSEDAENHDSNKNFELTEKLARQMRGLALIEIEVL